MSVNDLIRHLRDLKQADPAIGQSPVYAGDGRAWDVERVVLGPHGQVLLRPEAS